MALIEHLEKLRHFVSAAQSGSFSKAGEELRLSQPTLSHSVKVLEDVLGKSLFLRTSRGVRLTEEGKLLLEEAKRLLLQTEAIERKIKGGAKGILRVATKEPLAIHFLPFCLEKLSEEPEVLIYRSNTELVQLLLSEEVEAIVLPDPPDREEIVSYELYHDTLGLFISPKSKRDDLLYVFRNALCGNGKRVKDVLGTLEVPFSVKGLDSYEAVLAMTLQGLGRGLMPYSVARASIDRKDLKEVKSDFSLISFGSTSVCLSIHAAKARDPRVRAFVKACRETAKALA